MVNEHLHIEDNVSVQSSEEIQEQEIIFEAQSSSASEYLTSLADELKRPTVSATSSETEPNNFESAEENPNQNIFDGPTSENNPADSKVKETIKSIIENKGVIASMFVLGLEGGMNYAFPRLYKSTLFNDEEIEVLKKQAEELSKLTDSESDTIVLQKQSSFARELKRYNDNVEKLERYSTEVVPLKSDERSLLIEYINARMSTTELMSFFEKYPTLAIALYIAVPRLVPMGTDLLIKKMGSIAPDKIM